jgi:hypothetical protein
MGPRNESLAGSTASWVAAQEELAKKENLARWKCGTHGTHETHETNETHGNCVKRAWLKRSQSQKGISG